MKNIILPPNYKSFLSLYDTQIAIKVVKDTFETQLANQLDLIRVSASLFVDPKTGLNDNLCGYEKAVSFTCNENKKNLEVVQSLAKWKRNALKKYDVNGLYTDMNAIRPFEEMDNLHSLYVDQWDWERRIDKEERNIEFLKDTVRKIYESLKETEKYIRAVYPILTQRLPLSITFITTEELEKLYPQASPKERENIVTKKYGAVFLIGIGNKLSNGEPHDARAADYDDWNFNGDILLYDDILDIAFEISSMGIRVDRDSLIKQLKVKNEEYKIPMRYHQDVINGNLPLSIGGGIGQSRMCMYMLHKAHIGEVQSSYWTEEDIKIFEEHGIKLL